jgi:hypothetical protein
MNIISAPMRITRGEPFSWTATVVGQDWTGYTGTVTFRRNGVRKMLTPDYGFMSTETDPILTETVTGDAAGVLSFSLTAAQTDLFPALNRIGWFAQAKAEISMTDGSDVQKYQLRVSTAESFV